MNDKLYVGASSSITKTLNEEDIFNFAEICGDYNPIHVDKEEAQKSRFGKQICHGMLVTSFISTVLGMHLPGPGTIYLEQSVKFLKPVYIGDTITATASIIDIQNKIVKLETNVINQNKEKVVAGKALVMVDIEK